MSLSDGDGLHKPGVYGILAYVTLRQLEERLKAISTQLIGARQSADVGLLLHYAHQAGLPVQGQAPHHLFMKTIQVYHPDRLASLWDQRQKASGPAEVEKWESLLRLREAPLPRPQRTWSEERHDGDGDADEDEDDDDDTWDPDAGTFYSAIKRALFGNLEFYPDAADLRRLEGELDLSACDLNDLEGIEHCQGLTALNLAQNGIDNVYPLKDLVKLQSLDLAENHLEDADWLGGLVNLVELDLSANDIDDVAFLDRLPRLRYVDLTGNPVRNRAVLGRLEARGVIVIL